MLQLFVDPDLGGIQLQDFLERAWPGADRRFFRQAMSRGALLVNREACRPQQRLRAGDLVEIDCEQEDIPRRPEAEPVSAPGELEVLHEDDRQLVVNKPAGMHTLPDRGGKYLGVHGLLQELRPGDDLRIVHRLDAGTSGCLALAKGLESARLLDLAFRQGRVEKEYAALVEGVVRRPRFEVSRHLGPDRRRPGKVKVVEAGSKGSRAALTLVEVAEQFRRHALLVVRPRTGRSHQIRVHLASVGHPVAGDPDYGSGRQLLLSRLKPNFKLRRGVEERPLLRRMFLHAGVLGLPGRGPDEPMVFARAPLPDDLEMVLVKLRRFSMERGVACD